MTSEMDNAYCNYPYLLYAPEGTLCKVVFLNEPRRTYFPCIKFVFENVGLDLCFGAHKLI